MTKQVNFSLPDEDYDALSKLAAEQNRYVYQQARHMIKKALKPIEVSAPSVWIGEDASRTTITTTNADPPSTNTAKEPIPG